MFRHFCGPSHDWTYIQTYPYIHTPTYDLISEHNTCTLICPNKHAHIHCPRSITDNFKHPLWHRCTHMHTAFSPAYAECHCPIYFGSLNVPHSCPKRILSSPWAFFLLPRLQDDFFLMSSWVPGPRGSLSPVVPDPYRIPSMTASVTHCNCATRDMFPAVPQTQEAPSIQQGHKNTQSGINQLRFWVTTSMTNKPRQQSLNPRIWFFIYALAEPCLFNCFSVWL